jgi:hypothetical protein
MINKFVEYKLKDQIMAMLLLLHNTYPLHNTYIWSKENLNSIATNSLIKQQKINLITNIPFHYLEKFFNQEFKLQHDFKSGLNIITLNIDDLKYEILICNDYEWESQFKYYLNTLNIQQDILGMDYEGRICQFTGK